MKILYLIKREYDETLKKIIEEHKRTSDVSIVDLLKDKNYEQIIDLVTSSDRVISW
jgi:hypothetical protein